MPISNVLQCRRRQRKHDQDLITWLAHIHLVYLIRADVQRKAGREESGYQFHDMKMISIDTLGWWGATALQPDWTPLITAKQCIAAVEHVFTIYAQTNPTAKYLLGADFMCAFKTVFMSPTFKPDKSKCDVGVCRFSSSVSSGVQTADIWRMCLDLRCACWIAWIETYTPCALPAWWGRASELPSCQVCVGCILLTALSLCFAPPPLSPALHFTPQRSGILCVLCVCVCVLLTSRGYKSQSHCLLMGTKSKSS